MDSYNYDALQADVLHPLRPTGHGRYRPAAYNSVVDKVVRPPLRQAAGDALVVVEGLFLHRDGLAGVWDYSLFLDVPFEESACRMAKRDRSPDPQHEAMRRYVGGQRLYFAQACPWERASLVIDNCVPTRPRVIAPDHVSAIR